MFGNWESNSSLPISSIVEKAGARKQLTSNRNLKSLLPSRYWLVLGSEDFDLLVLVDY